MARKEASRSTGRGDGLRSERTCLNGPTLPGQGAPGLRYTPIPVSAGRIQPVPVPRPLHDLRRDTLRLSVLEGVLYAGMVGLGEFWFVADAVRQHGSTLALAALVTVPQLVGALGSTAMLRALRSARAR